MKTKIAVICVCLAFGAGSALKGNVSTATAAIPAAAQIHSVTPASEVKFTQEDFYGPKLEQSCCWSGK